MQGKIIDLIQGSDEWKQFRKGKIGASDVPAICGVSPYQTAAKLLTEKVTGVTRQVSDYVQKIFDTGHEWEEKIRSEHFSNYKPVVVQSAYNPDLFCSLDGLNENQTEILEIKSTSKNEYWEDIGFGKVPTEYDFQIQYQFFVTGLKEAKLAVINKNTNALRIINVYRNDTRIDLLVQTVTKFLEQMKQGVVPVQQLQNETMEHIAQTKATIDEYKKLIKAEEDKLKALGEGLLNQFPEATKIEGAGCKIEWASRKGNIDYDQIEVLKTVDLEKYRKPSSRYVKLTVLKQKKEGNDDNE